MKGGAEVDQIKRVKYNNCPLMEVVYQLNFPTILAIEADIPAEFQMKIRKEFPQYQLQMEQGGELTVNITGAEINPLYRQRSGRKLHHFISEDGKWKITLAKNQLSISTLDYKQWENLKERFEGPLVAFTSIYKQDYFERIGLRYVDAISKTKLHIENTEWSELLQPHLLGCLGFTGEDINVGASSVQSEMTMGDVTVKVSSGLAQVNTSDGTVDNAFVLDCDYFCVGKTEMADIDSVAEKLHQKSTTFFRQSITSKLHEAMKPQEIE